MKNKNDLCTIGMSTLIWPFFRSRPHMTLAVGGTLNRKINENMVLENEAPKLLELLLVSKLVTENLDLSEHKLFCHMQCKFMFHVSVCGMLDASL